MSNCLVIDTSSRYLTVIAAKDGRVAKRHIPDCALNHSVILMDEADKTLDEVGLSPRECDFFGAVTGPGSFTGIRIGISAIKGFATALGKRGVGVTSFEMISYNVNSDCHYAVAIDAAHGYYYVCGYAPDGSEDIAPCYLSGESVAALNRPVYGFEELPFGRYTRLNADECLLGALPLMEKREGGLAALYVRRSQAEEERAKRLGNL